MQLSDLYHLLTVGLCACIVTGCDADNYGTTILSGLSRTSLAVAVTTVNYEHYGTIDHHHGTDLDDLSLDEALLTIISRCSRNVTLYICPNECYQCKYRKVVELGPKGSAQIAVGTTYDSKLHVSIHTVPNPRVVCQEIVTFLEHGNYTYYISPNSTLVVDSSYVCVLSSADPPADCNIPVWIAFAVLVGVALLTSFCVAINRRHHLYAIVCLRSERLVNDDLGLPPSVSSSSRLPTPNQTPDNSQEYNKRDEEGRISVDTTPGAPLSPNPGHGRKRLKSLDTFRGISIVVMIFVNYGGGEYWYFKHSPWNGLTVADLVFPWFIFIMGTSMIFSYQSLVRRNTPRKYIILKIVKRSVILILLGIMLNSSPKCPHKLTRWSELRIPGVLQRFGLTYFCVAIVHLFFINLQPRPLFGRLHFLFADISVYWPEWIIHLCLLTLYLTLTFLLPVPGCPTGYLGPGGLSDDGDHQNCTGGAAGYIDRTVFGPSHIYQHPTSMKVYFNTIPYDPEGLLGCLTSIFLCFLGLQAGKILQIYKDIRQIVSKWALWSVLTGCTAILLCEGKKEGGWIPINKNLWSLSYVLSMAGMSFILLIVCYLLIDHFHWWNGQPFIYPGMNAILLYLGHEIFHYYLPITFHVPMNHAAQLSLHIWATIFWVIVAYVLYRKKIFLSI